MTDLEHSLFDDKPFEEVVQAAPVKAIECAKPPFDVHRLRNGDLMLVYLTQASEKFEATTAPETAGVLFRYEGAWYTLKVKKASGVSSGRTLPS